MSVLNIAAGEVAHALDLHLIDHGLEDPVARRCWKPIVTKTRSFLRYLWDLSPSLIVAVHDHCVTGPQRPLSRSSKLARQ